MILLPTIPHKQSYVFKGQKQMTISPKHTTHKKRLKENLRKGNPQSNTAYEPVYERESSRTNKQKLDP